MSQLQLDTLTIECAPAKPLVGCLRFAVRADHNLAERLRDLAGLTVPCVYEGRSGWARVSRCHGDSFEICTSLPEQP